MRARCSPPSTPAPAAGCQRCSWATICRLAYDSSLAAALGRDENSGAPVLITFRVPQLAFSITPVQDLYAFAWVPGQHTLLLLGPGRIARLAVDSLGSNRPLQLTWSSAQRAAGPNPPCMDMAPNGAAVVIVQSRGWETHVASQANYSIALYSTADLSFQCSGRFPVPAAALPAGGHASVHCGTAALAVCFGSSESPASGTAVHGLQAGKPGALLFYANDLTGVSWCHGYLAGIRTQAVEVLDGCTGWCLLRWQPALVGSALRAEQVAWAGPGRSRLHVTSTGQRAPLLWTIVSF